MNSSAARDIDISIWSIFLFLFFFCAFLVSYITSDFSPVRRIINRFIHTIFEFIAAFPRAFFTFGDFSIEGSSEDWKKKKNVDTERGWWTSPTRMFAWLEVGRFFSAYVFRNWCYRIAFTLSLRKIGVVAVTALSLSVSKSVLLAARWLHWSMSAEWMQCNFDTQRRWRAAPIFFYFTGDHKKWLL